MTKWQKHTRTDLARFSEHLKPDRTNILCPSGIGDLYWIVSKFWDSADNAIFWFPGEENRRAGPLADILGVDYGYLPGLTTDFVWSQPGSDPIDGRNTLVVQANRHLESGKHIRDWYPELELHYPAIIVGYTPPSIGDYICVFTCSHHYMGGQLHPTVWANMIKCLIQSTGKKVVLIGAGSDVPFCREIETTYQQNGTCIGVYDRPLTEVMAWIKGSDGLIGVASGFSIISTCIGVPTITGYPRHLDKLPGTFEPEAATHDWVFLDQLPEYIFNFKHNDIIHHHG